MIKTPEGFSLNTASVGFKYSNRDDLLFIKSDVLAVTKGVFTKNKVKAAPVKIAQDFLSKKDRFRGILVNVGQANACTGKEGMDVCIQSLKLVGSKFNIKYDEIIPASTGVIGEIPSIDLLKEGVDRLFVNKKDPVKAAKAIMTTDTFPKIFFKELNKNGKEYSILGIAKGAGMICPNMATMLCFILTNASIPPEILDKSLKYAVDLSFNRISVDSDTSTNDSVLVMANGFSGVSLVSEEEVKKLLLECCKRLAYLIVQDGEGATKVIRIKVVGADTQTDAETIARSVAHSPLVKTAFFGEDPNWGRIMAALGKTGVDIKEEQVSITIGDINIVEKGMGTLNHQMDDLVRPFLMGSEVEVIIDLGLGKEEYEILTCDFSYDYVRINAEYRS